MKNVKTTILTCGAFFVTAMFSQSCKLRDDGANHRNPGKSSILASIAGLSPGDEKRDDFKYALACDGKQPVSSEKPDPASTTVSFPGGTINDGDACALEIRGNENPTPSLVWNSSPEQKGLYYSSNKDKVVTRQLKLKLFKLYSPKLDEVPSFNARIKVKFELEGSDVMPETSKLSANIECTPKGPYSTKQLEADVDKTSVTFIFAIPVSEGNGTACNKITIAEDTIPKYDGDMKDVAFTNPKQGESLPFGPFSVKKKSDGPVVVTTEGGASCSEFDTATRKCLTLKLSRAGNYWFALVSTQKQDSTQVSYIVVPKSFTDRDDTGTDKSIKMIQDDLARPATDRLFVWFKPDVLPQLETLSFDSGLMASVDSFKVVPEEVTGTKLLAFEGLWVHGFGPIKAEVLNAKESARWFAIVDVATKEGLAIGSFVAGGFNRYFHSPARPGNNNTYFDWEKIKGELGSTANPTALFGIKGGNLEPSGCTATPDYYIDVLSLRDDDLLYQEDPNLETCSFLSFPEGKDPSAWTVKEKLYFWGWNRVL